MKRLHIALVYNAARTAPPDRPEDRASLRDLRAQIRRLARTLRKLGHTVTVVALAHDLFHFQRLLKRLRPDVVFNQYDDIVQGAQYEMRVAALVRMMGFPLTGSPALALGLCRFKFMTASLLSGVGIPVPPNTALLETVKAIREHKWQFPLIVQPSQEHAGIGLERDSIVYNKTQLRRKVSHILREYNQPALVQRFLRGREFNVGLVGGHRLRVLPLAEVDYSQLPPDIPPIMSYAAKWLENTEEYQKISVVCPAEVEPELAQRIGQIAVRAFRCIGGWGYGRVDVRLDENGQPYVLDVNCNPCLDEGLGIARQAERAGISFPELLQLILKAALERPPYDVDMPMLGLPSASTPQTPNGKQATAASSPAELQPAISPGASGS
jgi:D-alanine-D-alanine ligase